MKNFFKTVIFLALGTSIAFASDEAVILDTSEIFNLNMPTAMQDNLSQINNNEEAHYKSSKAPNYFDKDENVFETKFGQIFSNFIDDKAINNRINNYSSGFEKKILKE